MRCKRISEIAQDMVKFCLIQAKKAIVLIATLGILHLTDRPICNTALSAALVGIDSTSKPSFTRQQRAVSKNTKFTLPKTLIKQPSCAATY